MGYLDGYFATVKIVVVSMNGYPVAQRARSRLMTCFCHVHILKSNPSGLTVATGIEALGGVIFGASKIGSLSIPPVSAGALVAALGAGGVIDTVRTLRAAGMICVSSSASVMLE